MLIPHALCHYDYRRPPIVWRTGPHDVGTVRTRLRVRGAEGEHSLTVRLWYPTAGSPKLLSLLRTFISKVRHPLWAPAIRGAPLSQSRATYPLIAYIPDARTPQPDNTFTLAELASHGFVLAAIQNAFSGSRKNEANIDDPSRTSDDPNARMVRCGVRAACALLDALGNLRSDGPAGEWAGKMDLQRVGIMGYALGGTVAHASAIREPRYVAAISLDGARVTNTPDDVPYMQLRSEASDAIDASTAPPNGSVLTSGLVDAPLPLSHIIEIAGSCPEHFTDWLVTASACAREPFRAMAARIRTILDTYTVAFFETYVLGTPHPLICVRHSPFPEVRFLAPLYSAHQSESPRRKSKLH